MGVGRVEWKSGRRGRPGAGRNGENPWDCAGSTCRRCNCMRIGARLVGAFIGHCSSHRGMGASSRPELIPGQLCCVGVLVVGDQGSAFNEIPLILLPPALLVSYIQNSTPLFEPALVSNCLDLSSQC